MTGSLIAFLRRWLAGKLFNLAGRLDGAYDVWLDEAPRRGPRETRWCEDCGKNTPHAQYPTGGWWCVNG